MITCDQLKSVQDDARRCPFCGGAPEIDTVQGLRFLKDGRLGSAVAVYCTVCDAGIKLCREEMPDFETKEILATVLERWNRRQLDERFTMKGESFTEDDRMFMIWALGFTAGTCLKQKRDPKIEERCQAIAEKLSQITDLPTKANS